MLGRLRALGLVLLKLQVSEGRSRAIEGNGQMRRPMVLQHFEQHQDEAVDGAGCLPRLAGRQPWEGVKGTMYQSMSVEENQEWFVQVTNLQQQPTPYSTRTAQSPTNQVIQLAPEAD